MDIWQRHISDTDPLSQSLSTWSASVAQLIETEPDDFVFRLAERIDVLRRGVIPVNPLDESTIGSLVIENGRYWEEWQFTHARSLRSNCPYDGHRLGDATRHLFVDEMLAWLGNLLASSRSELQTLADAIHALEATWDRSGWLNQAEVLGEEPIEAAMLYVDLARDAVSVEQNLAIAEVFVEATAQLALTEATTRGRTEAHLQGIRANLADGERTNRESLAAIEETNRRIQEALQGQIDQAREDLRRLSERLSGAETRIGELQQQASSLANELANCRQQNEQNRQAANNSGGGGCSIM